MVTVPNPPLDRTFNSLRIMEIPLSNNTNKRNGSFVFVCWLHLQPLIGRQGCFAIRCTLPLSKPSTLFYKKKGARTLPIFRYSTVTSLLYQLPLVIVQVIIRVFFISYCSLQKCPNTTIKVPQNVSIFYQANMLYIVCFISDALVFNFQHFN